MTCGGVVRCVLVSDISSTYSAGYFVVLGRTVIKSPVSQRMFKLFTHVTLFGEGVGGRNSV